MKQVWRKYRENYAAIIKLGIPILIGQLGMIVVAFADNIMVGRYSTEGGLLHDLNFSKASFVNVSALSFGA